MHDVNYLAVLVAGIVPMIVGSLWYGPLFSKRWLELMETTEEEIAAGFNPLKTYGVSFLLAVVTAWVLAQLLAGLEGGGAMAAVHVVLLLVIGIVVPVAHQSVAFEKRKTGLAVLNAGYNLVALLGQAILLALWM